VFYKYDYKVLSVLGKNYIPTLFSDAECAWSHQQCFTADFVIKLIHTGHQNENSDF